MPSTSSSTITPPPRPATPGRSPTSDQKLLSREGDSVAFAIRAVLAIREECGSLRKQLGYKIFLDLLTQRLLDVKKRLDAPPPLTEARITRLLTDLERLVKWPNLKEPKRLENQAYQRLVQLLNGQSQYARKSIKILTEGSGCGASKDRTTFLKTFKAFAAVKREPRGLELSELIKSNPKPTSNDYTTECLQTLHSTLLKMCRCPISGGFKANVAPDVITPPADSDSVVIDLLFLHRHIENNGPYEWKEAQIRVSLESVTRADSANSTTKYGSLQYARTGGKIQDFCDLILSRELGRLSLCASSYGFFNDGFKLPPHQNGLSLWTPSVSLAEVIPSTSLRSDNQRKLLLSYLLAKAVWQFYESDWMIEAWTKYTVHFMQKHLDKMQKSVQLYHKPFITANLWASAVESNSVPKKGFHIFPKILALGVMLLEIELGENIEHYYQSYYLDNGKPRQNAEHITASNIISSKGWKGRSTYDRVKEAIEICVRPDTSKLGLDPINVRENLYRTVVAPLMELFKFSWNCPDGCPEKFDPGPMDFTPADELADIEIYVAESPDAARTFSSQVLIQQSRPCELNSLTADNSQSKSDREPNSDDLVQAVRRSPDIKTKSERDYTVGWICAIAIELAAVTAILDEVHETSPISRCDHDIYKFGRIGCHNVVIACLPAGSYGNISAATVATGMKIRFPDLKFGLMVGVGGGIPSSATDIRLGDIVVGLPTGVSSGILQYDSGKTVERGEFIRTGSLDKPPLVLLNALQIIRARNPRVLTEELGRQVLKLSDNASTSRTYTISEAQRPDDRFCYPGRHEDNLFSADYEHLDNSRCCKSCDASKLVRREPRNDENPHVHYGIIASGSQVIRHGLTRDKISRETRAICFEMEAAGLMNNFPCLVVRGISDYSDSHKNDQWQGYAAAAAAVFAKELLLEVPPTVSLDSGS
ncbi:hypothetical protein TWF730_004353 [Orbilia blumenaviensis]|uniref:DUF7580 domain-containing protein n=1 Tax=Orbilia blumenaviensis TaxID=1796055 RepID=A0AAV9U0X8_9PEZI